jgi:hypothetical protein
MVPRVQVVKINDHEYHLARDLTVWRKEVKKNSDLNNGECHHIMGRTGILKLLIENGVYISLTTHSFQKSLSTKERDWFTKEVKRYIPLDLYDRLLKIKNTKTLKVEVVPVL